MTTPPKVRSTTLRQLMDILSPRRWRILTIILTLLVGAGLELVPPLVMQRIIDQNLTPGVAQGLWLLAAIYLAALAGSQSLGFLTNYLTALTAQGALRDLRVRLYSHLQNLPMRYYDQNPLGDIISRCTADVDTVDTLFSSGVAGLAADLIRLVTVTIAMVALSPILSLISAVVAPPLIWLTKSFRLRIRDAEGKNRIAVGMLNTHLQESLGGVEVIRAYGREKAFVARFRQALKRALEASNQSTRFSTFYTPFMQILMAAVIAVLLWAGASTTLSAWKISLGTLTAFVLLFKRFFDPITALGEEWQTVQSALSGAERIFQVLDLPVEKTNPEDAAATIPVGGIDVRGVTFGYFEKQPVLNQVSFTVRPGEHVALVGRTGAGKSSILSLLGGLYVPWEGSLSVAGLNPRALPDSQKRKVVGVVPQSVQLFSGTVFENLTLSDTNVSREEVEKAACIAGADEFIRALPQGYATPLSSRSGRGVQLSSGQRQLLSLTRALVWNPVVLLFDEATSAIDSASEAAFREALQNQTARRSRAILTVAHRLSTARQADRVIVLENGRIIETGSPDELVRMGGRFAALLEMEAAGWDWHASQSETL
jgi:ATP-binding cassette subfamily B multidrug efflux pump